MKDSPPDEEGPAEGDKPKRKKQKGAKGSGKKAKQGQIPQPTPFGLYGRRGSQCGCVTAFDSQNQCFNERSSPGL